MMRVRPALVLLTLCGCGGNQAEITALTERLAKLEGAEKSRQAEVKPDADEKADEPAETAEKGLGRRTTRDPHNPARTAQPSSRNRRALSASVQCMNTKGRLRAC